MCEYQELMKAGSVPDMRRRMQPRQLKSLVEAGHYKPEPALVAAAMLERRGMRSFLADEGLLTPAGRSRVPAAPAGRRAA
jgi:hypothetical protein